MRERAWTTAPAASRLSRRRRASPWRDGRISSCDRDDAEGRDDRDAHFTRPQRQHGTACGDDHGIGDPHATVLPAEHPGHPGDRQGGGHGHQTGVVEPLAAPATGPVVATLPTPLRTRAPATGPANALPPTRRARPANANLATT